MKFNQLKSSILKQFEAPKGWQVVPFIVGTPGGGKSACVREIARELATRHQIPAERIVEFNPSLRDPCDILGIPFKSEDGTHSEWLPPSEFYSIRKGQGPSILILEEMSDAQVNMQNPLCRVLLDRFAGQMPLAEELYIMATGNRVQDKSGANRVTTKLGNRVRTLQFDSDVEDWIVWAVNAGVSQTLCSFIKWKPALLNDFDPSRSINPTPRSWENVSRVPEDLPPEEFLAHIEGDVGAGPAAEYVGFLKLAKNLPSFDQILKEAATIAVPTEPNLLYAICGSVAYNMNKQNIKALWKFIKRLKPEFQSITMLQAYRLNGKSLVSSPEFTQWAVKNGELLQGMA